MNRFFTITLSVVLLCVLSATADAQTFARVAAWNQQGVEFNDEGEAVPVHKPGALRAAIAAINADVIALSEVNSRAALDEIVTTPFANGFRYKIDMDNGQTVPQKIAVMFKDSPNISVSNRRAISGSDDNHPDRHRKAYAFDVRIRNFDFLLIAVHLKSGRGTTERNIRTRQAQAIARFIENEIDDKPERDVLVMGDYNMIPGPDDVNFQALSPGSGSQELLRFISSDIPGDPPTHIDECLNVNTFDGNHLDGFSITRGQTTEWTGFVRALPIHQTLPSPNRGCFRYRRRVSDHIPVVARFRTSLPDDD